MATAVSRTALRGRAVRSGRPPRPAPAEAHAVVSLVNRQSPLYPGASRQAGAAVYIRGQPGYAAAAPPDHYPPV